MAFTVHACLVFLILTGSYLNSVEANYRKYVSLIFDVHSHYKTSSVFFILSKHDQTMQDYSMVHLLSRMFSKQSVSTLIVNYNKVNKRLNFYRKQIVRPLVVALIKSASDIAEFNDNIQERTKSYPIWLVIFSQKSDHPICEYCTRPQRNILQLRFDTAMLVVCCDNPQLQEWWSVHKNETETDEFGIRTENEQLKILAVTKGLSPKRRDVQGTQLRIVVVSSSALIHDYDDAIGGFLGRVYNELKVVMNFTTGNIQKSKEFGGYDEKTSTWSGAVGMLVRGEADFAIADFAITNARLRAIDFTYPLVTSQNRLFIKKPESQDVKWSAYFKAFKFEIWEMIIVLIIITPLLLAIIKAKRLSISLLSLGIDSYICVWGVFCQQGLSEFPPETPLRVAYFSIFILALVISAAYSASFISHLTLSPSSLPFKDLEGYVKDGSYKLIVLRNSSNYNFLSTSNDPVHEKMITMMKPWEKLPLRISEAWDQVCNERVAFFTTDLDKTASEIECRTAVVGSGRVDSLAMGLSRGSQYTDVINYHIERFRVNGMISRLKRKYNEHKIEQVKRSYDAVEFSGVAPLLSVLAGGIIIAIIILVCEKMYYYRKNNRQCLHGCILSCNPTKQSHPNLSKKETL